MVKIGRKIWRHHSWIYYQTSLMVILLYPTSIYLLHVSNVRMNADLFKAIFKWLIIYHFFLVENKNTFCSHFEVNKYIEYRIYRGIRIKRKMESFNRLGKCVRKRDLYYAQFNFFSVLRYHQSSYHFSFSLGIIP